MTQTLYLALGSNLNQPLRQLRQAARILCAHPHFKLLATSSIYRSAPLGPATQAHYLNAVLALHCTLPALKVLAITQSIEHAQGRRKRQHWGPRSLDIDLLLYGRKQVSHPTLRIPHPGLLQRPFVLTPLLEIAPSLSLPDGQILDDAAALHESALLSPPQRIVAPLLPRQLKTR